MGQKFSRLVVNIEPAICDGHLPFLWERRKRGVRELDVRGDGGVGGAKRLRDGRVGEH